MGDHVVVINTKDVVFTGKKWDQKLYRHHTGLVVVIVCDYYCIIIVMKMVWFIMDCTFY